MPRDTQQIIQTAFIRLLNQKPLDRITVKDIVSECNVSRIPFIIIIRIFMHCWSRYCWMKPSRRCR